MPLSIEQIRSALEYNSGTGELIFKPRENAMFNTKHAGRKAFNSLDAYGYRQGNLLGKMYKAHRVIWALHYGEWPKGEIDHINGDRADNRIVNLRVVTASENRRNMRPRRDLPPGINKVGEVWQARMKVSGKEKYLGRHKTLELAIVARKRAEIANGFHPNHGVDVHQLSREAEIAA